MKTQPLDNAALRVASFKLFECPDRLLDCCSVSAMDGNVLVQPVITFLSCRQDIRDRRLRGFAAIFSALCERFYTPGELIAGQLQNPSSLVVSDGSCLLNRKELSGLTRSASVLLGNVEDHSLTDPALLKLLVAPGHTWIQHMVPDIISDPFVRFGLIKRISPVGGDLSLSVLFRWGKLEWTRPAQGRWPKIEAPGWAAVAHLFGDFYQRAEKLAAAHKCTFCRVRFLSDGITHGLLLDSVAGGVSLQSVAGLIREMTEQTCGPLILNVKQGDFELGFVTKSPGGVCSQDLPQRKKNGIVFFG